MPRFLAVLGYAVVFSVLVAFFSWVVYEMAWHSGSLFRVWKMAIGFGLAAAGLLLGLLLTWIGSRVKRLDRARR
jgi:hypothetical protein